MRVLLVTANYRPSVGGIERFVEILADGLADRGHEVTVATCRLRSAPLEEWTNGVRVVRVPASDVMRRRLDVPLPLPAPRAGLRTLSRLVAEADVVHAQDALYPTTLAALGLARRRRLPSVLTQHVQFVPQRHRLLDLAQSAAIATLGRCARLATVVASYNPAVAEWAKRQWGLRDVRLLPIGVPAPGVAESQRALVRQELGLEDDAFLALFTGRDVAKKHLDVFLAASDASYELVAVTDRSNGAGPGTRLLPFTSSDRYAQLLTAADAFVLPSEGEGFPLALQEALVAGVPCVITREPGYERFVSEDDVVFVEREPEQIRGVLRRLALDDTYRAELASRARMAGERSFGVERFVDAYLELYEEMRAKGRGSA